MPKTKWDGAEDHTINNFYKIDNRVICICSYNCVLSESIHSILCQPKLTVILLGDKCPRGLIWYTRHKQKAKCANIRTGLPK